MNEVTESIDCSTPDVLYLAFELSQEKWKLGFTSGMGQTVWKRVVAAGDLLALGKPNLLGCKYRIQKDVENRLN